MHQQTRANVPITIDLSAPLVEERAAREVARACETARLAIGPTARPTIVYQSPGEGCLHMTAVFVAGDDAPAPGEAELQLLERIFPPPARPEPPPAPRSAPAARVERAGADDGWIQTASGRAFFPLTPEPADLDLFDIASGLSRQCRYGGQLGRLEFYSVAEHSVLLSHAVPPELAAWALLHDASEAYLCDVPRPIKGALGLAYAAAEERLMRAVAQRFDLPWPMPEELKQYDTRILQNERRALWPNTPPRPWSTDQHGPPLPGITVAGWLPYQARSRFLARADELGVREVQG